MSYEQVKRAVDSVTSQEQPGVSIITASNSALPDAAPQSTAEDDCCVKFLFRDPFTLRAFMEAIKPYDRWPEEERAAYETFHAAASEAFAKGQTLERMLNLTVTHEILKYADDLGRFQRMAAFVRANRGLVSYSSLDKLIAVMERALLGMKELNDAIRYVS